MSEVKLRSGDNTSLLHRFLDLNPEFVKWIENTRLFNAIKADGDAARKGWPVTIRAEGVTEYMELSLNGIVVKTAYDLPLEIIAQFLKNYPERTIQTNEPLYLQ